MSKTLELFRKEVEGDIYSWVHYREDSVFELEVNSDVIAHDSYGNENSHLERVFKCTLTDEYIKVTGTRCSYSGEEWSDDVKIVKPMVKQVTIFE